MFAHFCIAELQGTDLVCSAVADIRQRFDVDLAGHLVAWERSASCLPLFTSSLTTTAAGTQAARALGAALPPAMLLSTPASQLRQQEPKWQAAAVFRPGCRAQVLSSLMVLLSRARCVVAELVPVVIREATPDVC